MKKMLVLMAVLAISSMAVAQIDPDPDGLSVYLDEEATQYCLLEAPVYVAVPVYIVLTNSTEVGQAVLSWELRVELDSNAAFGVDGEGNCQWTLSTNAISIGDAVDLIIGTASGPVSIDGTTTILASGGLVYGAPGGYANFSVGRTTGSTTFGSYGGYSIGVGQSVECQHPFGMPGGEAAWIGSCPDVVANEDKTWGEVKALY